MKEEELLKMIKQKEYDILWLEKRLFEAEKKLAKIEIVLGKEKFEEVLNEN